MGKYLRALAHECSPQLMAQHQGPTELVYVTPMLESSLGKIRTDGIVKAFFSFHDDDARGISQELLNDVVQIGMSFRYGDYANKTGLDRPRHCLDLLCEGLAATGERYGWDTTALTDAYEDIARRGFVFDHWSEESARNPSRSRSARVYWRFEHEISVYLVIYDSEDVEIARRLVTRLPASLGAVRLHVGDVAWDSDDQVVLWHSNGRDRWDYDIAADSVQFHFHRAERGDPHGQYDLAMMYLHGRGVLEDRTQAMGWLRKAAQADFTPAVRALDRLEPEAGDRR